MSREQVEYITTALANLEEYIYNLNIDDDLIKNNIQSKLAELIFWITYSEDGDPHAHKYP